MVKIPLKGSLAYYIYIAGKGKNNLPVQTRLTRTLKPSPQNFSTAAQLQHSIEQSHINSN